MRKLGILTPSQEDQGLRLVEVYPKIFELRDFESFIIAYAGSIERKLVIKDADEYLRTKHTGDRK